MLKNIEKGEKQTVMNNKKGLSALYLAVLIDLLGFGLVLPILPFWATNIIGTTPFEYGILVASFSMMQFMFAPVWGKISDVYGRRPIILIGLTGTIISFSFMTFTAVFFLNSLILLLLSRIMAGFFTAATLPTAHAYISDSTTGEERTKAFGMIGAAFGIGFTLGPAIGSIFTIVGEILIPSIKGYWAPAAIMSLLAIFNLLLAKNSLLESKFDIKNFEVYTSEVIESQTNKPSLIKTLRDNGKISVILVSFLVFAITGFAFSSLETTFALLGKVQFGLTETLAGAILVLMGIITIITQGVFIRPLSNKLSDTTIISLGVSAVIIGTAGFIFVNSLFSMIFFAVIFIFGISVTNPTIGSYLSKQVNGTGIEGTILGLNQSFGSFMRVIGPLLGTLLFETDISLPYSFASMILFISLLSFVSIIYITQVKFKNKMDKNYTQIGQGS